MTEKKSIDAQLLRLEHDAAKNWQRLSFVLRKHLDSWAHHNFKPLWREVKLSHMPIVFNIRLEGSTASEISRDSMLPKQTVSRSIKELEEKKLIISKTSDTDRRIELLSLTERGKEFIVNAMEQTVKLNEVYINLVGSKDLATATKVINAIIAYHESEMGEQK